MPSSPRPDGWDVIYYRTTDGGCPADDFLDGCPVKVSAQLVAVLDDVAEAPPPRYSGGGRWEVMLHSRLPLTADGPTIQAGGSLSFSLQLSNWCDRSATMPLHFLLALAAGSIDIVGLTLGADDLPPCNDPGQPASISTTDWEHR